MITRAWIGPELEGYSKGVPTLFIEGISLHASEIISIYNKCENVKRIYLGAGGYGLRQLENYKQLLEFAKSNEIKVVMELFDTQIDELPIDLLNCVELTYTITSDRTSLIDYLKTDDGKIVYVYDLQNKEETDLSTLKDGLYDKDTLIYEDENL